MFVLELTYCAPADRIEALREAHMAWVDEQFEAGSSSPPAPRNRVTAG